MYTYTLRIHAPEIHYLKISMILGLVPNTIHGWAYSVAITSDKDNFNFIETFLRFLEGKEEQLKELGGTPNNIEFWMVYEYEGQCNMEFAPIDLKRLGEKGYTLCISCYEV